MKRPTKYPFSFFQTVAWGDMDAFGHVNNVTYVRYFESARAHFFTEESLWETPLKPARSGPVLTHLEMDYRKQVVFPATLEITMAVSSISSRGFAVDCTMWLGSECVITCTANLVWFDFESKRPTNLPEVFKSKYNKDEPQ